MRILLVEDEEALVVVIAKRLVAEGYSVDFCLDGNDAICFIESTKYDCIVLDLLLPGIDGLSLLRTIRNSKLQTPVIILTAMDSTSDRVTGLDAGADDYVVKPFEFEELLARVRAMIRRQNSSNSNKLVLADLVVDIVGHTVNRAGEDIELTSKEFSVLEYLMFNKNKIVTREQIICHSWNYDFDCASNIVDVYIRYLRKKIDDGYERKLIHTMRGSGYTMRDSDK